MNGDTIKIRITGSATQIDVKLLIRHPMTTRVIDANGTVIKPPHHITVLRCWLDGREVYRADLGSGISQNPFFSFSIPHAAGPAPMLKVRWDDNHDDFDEVLKTVS